MPPYTAVVGHVSTHCPTRRSICLANSFDDTANSSTATPCRPSGVSPAASVRSTPASQPQPITEVAKPVSELAAFIAHAGVCAVMTSLVAFIGNASAKVASIVVPLICRVAGSLIVCGLPRGLLFSQPVAKHSTGSSLPPRQQLQTSSSLIAACAKLLARLASL